MSKICYCQCRWCYRGLHRLCKTQCTGQPPRAVRGG